MIIGISILEYLTKRKLTSAAKAFVRGEKILDNAVKYGYETAEGFTKAFKNEFGVLPSQVKKHKGKITFFEKLSFENNFPKQNQIEFEVVAKPYIELSGRKHVINFKNVKEEVSWDNLLKPDEKNKLEKPFYAIFEYGNYFLPNKIAYWILSHDARFGDEKHSIKEGFYLIFRKKKGRGEIKISDLIDLVYKDFASPEASASRNQEIEHYSQDFEEYWLPI